MRQCEQFEQWPFFTIWLKPTQITEWKKAGQSWQGTQGPAGWAVEGEVMLPPCYCASADAGTCRKWERLPALGLAPEAARGLLVSLQGHGCVCQSTLSWFGVAPNFQSVLNSGLECRSMVWLVQFGASGVLGQGKQRPGQGKLFQLSEACLHLPC